MRTAWEKLCARRGYGWGLAAVAMVYLLMAMALKLPLFAHSAHDSYALQAMVWRSGHIALPENYEWLELAIYQGRYYVSFPPFPAVPMWVLTFLFGADTPSMFINFLFLMGSYSVGYLLALRLGQGDLSAAAFAAFWVLGCNLLEVSLYGGVWNMAQGMAFFLMMLAVYGWQRGGKAWDFAAPVCLACAVGCRPFSAVYVPVALFVLWQRRREAGQSVWATIRKMIPPLIAPACIALAYGAYNYVRFANVFEFGHNYLPEFVEAPHGQLAVDYIGKNIANILRLPGWHDHQIQFPIIYGFAFYIANPLYILVTARMGEAIARRELEPLDILLLCMGAVHFFLFLMHKSFGAWQFGTRYLIDLLPVLGWFALRRKKPIRFWEGLVMLLAVGFNVYGGLLFHLGL